MYVVYVSYRALDVEVVENYFGHLDLAELEAGADTRHSWRSVEMEFDLGSSLGPRAEAGNLDRSHSPRTRRSNEAAGCESREEQPCSWGRNPEAGHLVQCTGFLGRFLSLLSPAKKQRMNAIVKVRSHFTC